MLHLRKCQKCGLHLVNLGWSYYSHPPQLDFFGRVQPRQCSDYGITIKITEPVVADDTDIPENESILTY
jgi:hypothetical protein